MKKVISILMVLAMTLVLFAGCSSEPAGPGKENEQLHVAMIFTQSLGDAGPMDSMNTNLKKAEEDFNIKVSTFEALQPSQYEDARHGRAPEAGCGGVPRGEVLHPVPAGGDRYAERYRR